MNVDSDISVLIFAGDKRFELVDRRQWVLGYGGKPRAPTAPLSMDLLSLASE
jgi:hypothetical protein